MEFNGVLDEGVLAKAKALGAGSSFVLAGLGCWLARRLEQGKAQGQQGHKAVLMLGNTLASGILLAAALVHMLPDALRALQDFTDFPLAASIAGGTFCFLVVLGEVAAGGMPERDDPHTSTDCVTYKATFALWPRMELMPPHGCDDAADEADPKAAATAPTTAGASTDSPVCAVIPEIPEAALEGGHGPCHGHTHGGHSGFLKAAWAGSPSMALPLPLPQQLAHGAVGQAPIAIDKGAAAATAKQPGHSCHSHSACCKVHRHSDTPCTTQERSAWSPTVSPRLGVDLERDPKAALVAASQPLLAPSAATRHGAAGHDHEAIALCHVRMLGGGPMAEVKSFLLFFALSFHSVMEGLGLGSAKDGGLLLSVMVAVLAHKGLAAFALGCSLTQSDLPAWKFWAFVLIFSAGTPLGCATASLFTDLDNETQGSLMSGVCIAMASGTFLQVSSMELLPRAFAEERHKALGGFGLVLGYAAMSALAVWC